MKKILSAEKARKFLAYATALVGVAMFFEAFLSYVTGDYRQFISSYAWYEGWSGEGLWGVFSVSAVRFTLRLAYVLSFLGLFFLRRWSVYLCLIAWLGQLIPSVLFAYFQGLGLDAGHVFSFVSLSVYLCAIAGCWPILKSGHAVRYCGGALLLGAVLHALCFYLLVRSSPVVAVTDDPIRQKELWMAVQKGDEETVRNLLSDKAFHPKLRGDNCRENSVCNLISDAAQDAGNVEIVRMLHEAGSLIDENDGFTGDTPIIRALIAGHVDVAEYLAKAGVDPMRTNRFGVPAFIVASSEGSPVVLEFMIKAGVDVNLSQTLPDVLARTQTRDHVNGITPLMMAAARGRIDLAETLLENGANPALVDEKGRDALAYARLGMNASIAPRLEELMAHYTPK